jgi:hypothetical protein
MANIGLLATIAAGFFFYGLRCRQRLYYGLFEVAVALVIIFLTFHPGTVFLITEDYTWWGWLLSKGVGVLAGVYAMVRGLDNIGQGGLDNIGQGLPAHFRARWDRWFYGKSLRA